MQQSLVKAIIKLVLLTLISNICQMAIGQKIDIQGHRGCRGLYPENTIEGFLHALDLGVNTLEMDVTISKDNKVIISHEPYFNHEFCLTQYGETITKNKELDHNIYEKTLREIRKYDTGSKFYKRFKKQKKLRTHKPSLQELVSAILIREEIGKINSTPFYNIEIKRKEKWDNVFHPGYREFADLVINKIIELGILEKTTVQCFDIPTLQYIKHKYPEVKLVYLIGNRDSPARNLQKLGFLPEVYSPHFKMVNQELVNLCKQNNIKLIPWTVNKKKDMKKMIKMGVDGIISDYPDILIKLINKLK